MRWSRLVPELTVSDLANSLRFYVDVLGFEVRFQRESPAFAYLEFEGSQLMLEQYHPDGWNVGRLVRPFGRGVNLQIACEDPAALRARATARGYELYEELTETWYDIGDAVSGRREFLIQDPDGYLLRFSEHLGDRGRPN